MSALPSILVVDDEESYRELARFTLADLGWEIAAAASAAAAMRMIGARGYDLVLIDGFLGDSSGPDLARRLIAARPGQRVLIYSVMNEEIAADALAAGALACLPKPARFSEVVSFTAERRP